MTYFSQQNVVENAMAKSLDIEGLLFMFVTQIFLKTASNLIHALLQNYNNKIALRMSKNQKKHRHNSLIDVPLTQRTAYFKQDAQSDPYRTLPSKSAFKNFLQQNQNIPLENKFINKENQFLKNIQEKLSTCKIVQKNKSSKKIVNACIKESIKNGNASYDLEDLERKIESIVEKRMKKMIESSVQKHFCKFMQEQRELLHYEIIGKENQLGKRLQKIEKGYDDILNTYDNFLILAEKIKDKSMKSEKYVKKTQIQTFVKRTQVEIGEVQSHINKITNQLQALKKFGNFNIEQHKMKPISLKYSEAQELGLEELRVVVNTYNENFMQIDQKLQEIYSYFT